MTTSLKALLAWGHLAKVDLPRLVFSSELTVCLCLNPYQGWLEASPIRENPSRSPEQTAVPETPLGRPDTWASRKRCTSHYGSLCLPGGHRRPSSDDQGGRGPEDTGKAPVGGYSFLRRKTSLSHIFFSFEKKGLLPLKSTGDGSKETSLPLPSQENIVTLQKKEKDTRNRGKSR